jgi:hypothetical protein
MIIAAPLRPRAEIAQKPWPQLHPRPRAVSDDLFPEGTRFLGIDRQVAGHQLTLLLV